MWAHTLKRGHKQEAKNVEALGTILEGSQARRSLPFRIHDVCQNFMKKKKKRSASHTTSDANYMEKRKRKDSDSVRPTQCAGTTRSSNVSCSPLQPLSESCTKTPSLRRKTDLPKKCGCGKKWTVLCVHQTVCVEIWMFYTEILACVVSKHIAAEKAQTCYEGTSVVILIRAIAMDSGSKSWIRNCSILSNLPLGSVDSGLLILLTSPSVSMLFLLSFPKLVLVSPTQKRSRVS